MFVKKTVHIITIYIRNNLELSLTSFQLHSRFILYETHKYQKYVIYWAEFQKSEAEEIICWNGEEMSNSGVKIPISNLVTQTLAI